MHSVLKAAAVAAALAAIAACGPQRDEVRERSRRAVSADRHAAVRDAAAPTTTRGTIAAVDSGREPGPADVAPLPGDDVEHRLPDQGWVALRPSLAVPVPRLAGISLMSAHEEQIRVGRVAWVHFRTPIEVGIDDYAWIDVGVSPAPTFEKGETFEQWATRISYGKPHEVRKLADTQVVYWPLFDYLPASQDLPERRTPGYGFLGPEAGTLVVVQCTGPVARANCDRYVDRLLAGLGPR
jgi:hypothetical protein